jgi:hypothetical protein
MDFESLSKPRGKTFQKKSKYFFSKPVNKENKKRTAMNYNWIKISDLSKVENLIKLAQRDIRTYGARKTSAEVQNENSAENISEQAQEMADTQREFNESTARLATLTVGSPAHKEEVVKFKKIDAKLSEMQLENETSGEENLLKREYSQAKTAALLATAIEFEAGGQARKAQLLAG